MLRAPIVVVLGHVDHGKTSLLDKIRSSTVTSREGGGITQYIGATNIPISQILQQTTDIQEKFKIADFKIPGLLFIDTPGHEAFISLRCKGSSVADLAILVVDINKGFEQQTIESIEFLKKFKVPFIVAANKVDFLYRWQSSKGLSITDSLKNQSQETLEEIDTKTYSLVGALSEHKFESERFDRVTNFKQQIAIIPCSAKTGDGVAEILLFLLGIGSNYLKTKLEIDYNKSKGIIMEIKKEENEWVCNAILYNGIIKKGDIILTFGNKEIIETKVRALFIPREASEIREESLFKPVEKVIASCAIKLFAQDVKEMIAGSPLVVANENLEEKKRDLQQTFKQEKICGCEKGIVVKVDTFGAAEAMDILLKKENIPFQYILVGEVNKEDVSCVSDSKEDEFAAILAFNVPVNINSNVKIFKSNVIFHLIDEYKKWVKDVCEEKKRKILNSLPQLVKIKVLPNSIFRKKEPAIIGVEVLAGVLKRGISLGKGGKRIGEIKGMQANKVDIDEAKTGEKVAMSINARADKDFSEGDNLTTTLTKEQTITYLNHKDWLREDEKDILMEILNNK